MPRKDKKEINIKTAPKIERKSSIDSFHTSDVKKSEKLPIPQKQKKNIKNEDDQKCLKFDKIGELNSKIDSLVSICQMQETKINSLMSIVDKLQKQGEVIFQEMKNVKNEVACMKNEVMEANIEIKTKVDHIVSKVDEEIW